MGFAQAGTAQADGNNLAMQAEEASGLAAGGQVFWLAGQSLQISAGQNENLPVGWVADTPFATNGASFSYSDETIDLSTAANPAPESVYQSLRYLGIVPLTYIIPGFDPTRTYTVRFHWMEPNPGGRDISASINGTVVLPDVNILALTGGIFRALSVDVDGLQSDPTGTFTIDFTASGANPAAFINGMELFSASV